MIPSSSPFPTGWIASAPRVLWGRNSTYALVPYAALPPLPSVELVGSLAWLPALGAGRCPIGYDEEYGPSSLASLPGLQAQAHRMGLAIPELLVRFVTTPALYERIHSATGCFLEFSASIIDDPSGARGGLLRFLNDSQGCACWYVYMTPSGDHCVLASYEWRDGPEDEAAALDATHYFCCAPDFEHFLYRFWLEDEIWARVTRNEPLPAEQYEYLTAAIAARHVLPPEA